jgi:soluble lytic murein transglycosylase-like protein
MVKWISVLAVSAAMAQTPAAPAPKAAPAAPALSPAEAMRASIEKQRAAIEKQRQAARQQAESAGVWLKPGDPPPPIGNEPVAPQANCEPLEDAVVAPLIETTAKLVELQPELLRAVMERESGLRPCAVSSKGAQGLMQLMPDTALELGVGNPFDPKESLSGGAKFLKQLMDKYKGDLTKVLGAYNAGSAAVDQADGIPDIPETKDYVDSILKKMGITRAVPPNDPMPKPIEN